ncbi:collagen alpha-1(I) chain-like [Phoca vitulina]|uniref:collagen alpha-1(I) chain-like n=1 Tax=Phoca vitulina TaxID=9720 RepID=UPI001395DB22|nr:collagen alpha-1(I) chain-like [Phoca vitulina]
MLTASTSILASDLWNDLLVSCAARYWSNFDPQQWSLSPHLLVAGAGSRRPGRGLRDPGSPRSGEERNKGGAARRSPSPRPNFARGARAPGEPARCAEDPGVRAEPGLGAPAGGAFPDSRPQKGIPELPGGGGRQSRARGRRFPRKLRALPRMPLALAQPPGARGSGPCGAPPSPAVLEEPG